MLLFIYIYIYIYMNSFKIECKDKYVSTKDIIYKLKKDKDHTYYLNNIEDYHNAMAKAIFDINYNTYGYNDEICRAILLYSGSMFLYLNNFLRNNFKYNEKELNNTKIYNNIINIYKKFTEDNSVKYYNKKLCDNKYYYLGKNNKVDLVDLLKYDNINNIDEEYILLKYDNINNIDEEYMRSYIDRILSNIYSTISSGLKSVFTCPITLYRGMSLDIFIKNIKRYKNYIPNKKSNKNDKFILKENDIYITNHLLSVSYNYDIAKSFSFDLLLKIHLPSNTKMIITSKCTKYTHEHELILDYATSFIITSIKNSYRIINFYENDKSNVEFMKNIITMKEYKKLFKNTYNKIKNEEKNGGGFFFSDEEDEDEKEKEKEKEKIELEEQGIFNIHSKYLSENPELKNSYDLINKSLELIYVKYAIINVHEISMVLIDDEKLIK